MLENLVGNVLWLKSLVLKNQPILLLPNYPTCVNHKVIYLHLHSFCKHEQSWCHKSSRMSKYRGLAVVMMVHFAHIAYRTVFQIFFFFDWKCFPDFMGVWAEKQQVHVCFTVLLVRSWQILNVLIVDRHIILIQSFSLLGYTCNLWMLELNLHAEEVSY